LASTDTKIYIDFNALEGCCKDTDILVCDITGYGTLASLSFHKIRLSAGQSLFFSDFDGLCAKGTVHFDPKRVKGNCSGWFAKFCRSQLTEIESHEKFQIPHLCFKCRRNLAEHL